MGTSVVLVLVVSCALYALFLWWYGGRGKPLSAQELEAGLKAIEQVSNNPDIDNALQELRLVLGKDDGCEFVMHNSVRYRDKALYPAGSIYSDDPRQADMRYGKLAFKHMFRYASIPIFIGKKQGSFIEYEGAPAWHYVALVRYRSKRDFLRFVLACEAQGVFEHKWAALGLTHVFPVKPLFSLVMVRGMAALILGIIASFVLVLLQRV